MINVCRICYNTDIFNDGLCAECDYHEYYRDRESMRDGQSEDIGGLIIGLLALMLGLPLVGGALCWLARTLW